MPFLIVSHKFSILDQFFKHSVHCAPLFCNRINSPKLYFDSVNVNLLNNKNLGMYIFLCILKFENWHKRSMSFY